MGVGFIRIAVKESDLLPENRSNHNARVAGLCSVGSGFKACGDGAKGAVGDRSPATAEAACSRNQTRGGHYGSCYQNLPCNVAYYEAKIHMLSSNLGSGSRRRERCSAANIGHYVSGVLDADLEGRDFGRP